MTDTPTNRRRWQFWIDRGGTFTDIVARRPDGALVSHKLLSESPEHYEDAAVEGMRRLLGLDAGAAFPADDVDAIKMGTTVATNALLERKGDATVLLITTGFGDALRIGYQNRPKLFDRHIVLPDMLYDRVIEVDERLRVDGEVLTSLDAEAARRELAAAYDAGIRSAAIVLMHGYRYPDHERALADIARDIGFTQVSTSHQTSPLMKLVSRGDTTVADAYLSPILRRYVDRVAGRTDGAKLMFMQSNGGLTDAARFQGKDSILSGPAGGVVGMVRTAEAAGYHKVIGFDMGGTSTDVSHYDGTFERAFETTVAGVRMRAPMMRIHTVAAGGGSILHFDGARFRVGPESAGADPGPACYRRGGPLTVTDCNVMLGKIQPQHFPHVFGPDGNEALDAAVVRRKFIELATEITSATGDAHDPEDVAEGFLTIAVENMANAIKRISVQRGYDVTEYALNCFGGAAGQHACLVADALGMNTVILHPLGGVLSAYGMGLAEVRALRERSVESPLADTAMGGLGETLDELQAECRSELAAQNIEAADISILRSLHIRYAGTDTALPIADAPLDTMAGEFEDAHRRQFGFALQGRALIVEAATVEAVGASETDTAGPAPLPAADGPPEIIETLSMGSGGTSHDAPVYSRPILSPGHTVGGPALIADSLSTTVIEPGWQADVSERGELLLTRARPREQRRAIGTNADPVMLEVFNNLFMSIAEQMGADLANTAHSVNIKERLDFSCAVFDASGNLVANAPHMPVHLGSMGESIKTVIRERGDALKPGDVIALNAPYNGGTHLPDVTCITPVFNDAGSEILFFAGSRGHHADIGGIAPGSMPPDSTSVEEEGILFDNFMLVDGGAFQEGPVRALLGSTAYPARNPDQNVADLTAQIAANERGVRELARMVDHFGLDVVQAYMGHVQDNAEESVRRVIDVLDDGTFETTMDDGSTIRVAISIDRAAREATVDFTGTSAQQPSNFNAPAAVTKAAVLYVFRTLVDDDIPLNAGCLKPVNIILPEASLLNPAYPAAVVAGNVETSQAVTDALYGALGTMAAAQGTMNNFTFGNDQYQYYETLCGGSGAGPDFDGTDAVHTHMTNSRLTDPEVLEWRYPVMVEGFSIRRGSGGDGEHQGGDGVIRKIKFFEPMEASILSNRRTTAPYGMAGGSPGKSGENRIERADGTVETLSHTGKTDMNAGDCFVIETPGGGGFGK